MKERNTFSLLFYIRKYRLDSLGQANIYLRSTANGEHSAFSTNHKVEVKSWDIHRGIVKPRTKDALEVNSIIQVLKNKAYKAYCQLLDVLAP